MKLTPLFALFWGIQDELSNWHPSRFVINDITYVNNEQYMMAAKARIFLDRDTEALIFAETNPRELKKLGRAIRGFDEKVWIGKREKVMFDGGLAKFSQNKDMGQVLLNTDNRYIVEASPVDPIWGVGLAEDDPRVLDPAQWQGLDLLGHALMRVRTELQIRNPPMPAATLL